MLANQVEDNLSGEWTGESVSNQEICTYWTQTTLAFRLDLGQSSGIITGEGCFSAFSLLKE